MCSKNLSISCVLSTVNVSSTYLHHTVGVWLNVSIAMFSHLSMNISATTGDIGYPMATPSVCLYIFRWNFNTVEVRHSCTPSIMSSSGTFVLSSSSWSEMSSFLTASIAIFIGTRGLNSKRVSGSKARSWHQSVKSFG
ncbi:unnamed protein product [Trichobilharzia szidati]|nr:unnamed protein product [Trichobilharzia szidati]